MFRAFVGVSAAVLLWSSPALASPAPYGPGGSGRPTAQADLTLSYMSETGFARAVKLTCDPAGGGHPKPADACATLASVAADPAKIPTAGGMCTMIYAPITAQLTGKWHGTAVNWAHDFGNDCEMRQATGVLFDF